MSYRKRYINPKIRNLRPKKRIWKNFVFWVLLLLIVIISSIFYIAFFWSKFQVQTIQILGNIKIESKEIEGLVLKHIQKDILGLEYKSIFFTDTKKIAIDILDNFPLVQKVDVKKRYPNTLDLSIAERNQFAVFCAKQAHKDCFSIDKDGVIFEKLQSLPKNILIVTQEDDVRDFFTGESVVEKKIMDAIYAVGESLKNDFQIDIQEAFVSNPIILKTSENWKLYFDSNEDISSQITKMKLLLKDQIAPGDRKKLQYIYLQYQDRAYYK